MFGLPCLINYILFSVFISCYSETVKLKPLSNLSFETTLNLPRSSSTTQLSISKVKLTFPRPHGAVFTTVKQVDESIGPTNPLQLIFSCQSPQTVNNCTVLVSEIFSQNTPLTDASLDLETSEYSIVYPQCTFDTTANNEVVWKSSTTTFNSDSSLSIDISTTPKTITSTCNSFTISYDDISFKCTPSSSTITVTGNSGKVTIKLTKDNCPDLPKHINYMQKARAILYSCECTVTSTGVSQSPATFTVVELRHPINVGVILLDIFFVTGTIICIVLMIIGLLKFREPNSCKCLSKKHGQRQVRCTSGCVSGQAEVSAPGTTDTLSTMEPSVLGEIRSDIDLVHMNRHANKDGSRLLSTQRISQ